MVTKEDLYHSESKRNKKLRIQTEKDVYSPTTDPKQIKIVHKYI